MNNTLASSSIVPCLLWSDRQLAISLGMGVKRVQQLARLGVLPGFKVGRKWQFDPDALSHRNHILPSGWSAFNPDPSIN